MVLIFCLKYGKTPGKLHFTKLTQETIEIPALTFLANQKQGIQMLQSKNKNS